MATLQLAPPKITEGTLQTSDGRPLPLEWTRVRAHIRGPLIGVEVRQGFHNPTSDTLEAVYLFPLPHQASVFRMEFRIGDRVVRGVIKEKEEARRTYEKARAEGRAASLLEQDRPNLFTLSLANIAPQARIEVLLEYQEAVAFDDGEWSFVFPMVAADHYLPSSDQAPPGAIRPPRPRSQERKSPLTLEVELQIAGQPPISPTHAIQVSSEQNGYRVCLAGQVANRDFLLTWRNPAQGLRPQFYTEREADRPGTFAVIIPALPLVTLTQPAKGHGCGNCGAPLEDESAIREVPELGRAWRCNYCGAFQPVQSPEAKAISGRDVVFLLDRSASMHNLDAARQVIGEVLGGLEPQDAFRLVAFHHELQHCSDDWLTCDDAGRARAGEFLAGLDSRGGTELEGALKNGAQGIRPNRLRLVVLLSDGAIGNEARLLRAVPKLLGSARLYVLGLGPAVNRYLLDKLALLGRGAYDVATGDQNEVLRRFVRRVREASPILTDIQISWADGPAVDVYPKDNRELFSGQSLRLSGRFLSSGPNTLVLTGKKSNGLSFRQEIEVNLPESSQQVPGLERGWARSRIEALQDELLRRPERLSDVRLEVLGLALKHQLMSAYTSLVAEDSEQSVDPLSPQRRVEVELAQAQIVTEERARAKGGPATGELAMPAPASSRRGSMAAAPASMAPPSPAPMMADLLSARCESEACLEETPGVCYSMELDICADDFGGPESSCDEEIPALRCMEALPAMGFVEPAGGMPPPPLEKVSRVSGQQAPPSLPPRVNYSPEELERARAMIKGHLDLVFLVDETGSMGAYIEQVKAHLLALIDALRHSPLLKTLRLGLVTFRDHPPQDHSFVTRVVPLTEDIAEIRQGVNRMQADGGGDGPEAVTDGLHDLLSLNWDQEAARLVVMVGDAPPHGVEPDGDGFPEGCPCGRHWYVQAESCREMGISVHTIGCHGIHSFIQAAAVFRAVAATTGGLYLPLDDARLLIGVVAGLADRELDRQTLHKQVEKVILAQRQLLELADLPEQVRFVCETLRAEKVRVLDLSDIQPGQVPVPTFREPRESDVAAMVETIMQFSAQKA